MAITTTDALVAGFTTADQGQGYMKIGTAPFGAGSFQSLWTANGFPSAGAAAGSTTGVICTSATTGAFPFANGGSLTSYLARFAATANVASSLVLYDRLFHNSGLSGTSTSAQSFSQPALTRYTSGGGNEIWIEIYSATGSTAVSITAAYTDGNNTAQTTPTVTGNLVATPKAGQVIILPMANSSGVRSVQSITLSATTGSAGNFGVTIAHRLATIPCLTAGVATVFDPFQLGIPVINDNACIALLQIATATTATTFTGGFDIVQG